MKIHELIQELEAKGFLHDDADVAIDDADTGWHLAVKSVKWDEKNKRVLISGNYGDCLDVIQ